MGNWFQTIGDVEATAGEAEALAAVGLRWLVETGVVAAEPNEVCVLGAGPGYPPGPRYVDAVEEEDEWMGDPHGNGMKILTAPTVFHSGQDELCGGRCPHCGSVMRFVDEEREFDDPLRFDEARWRSFARVMDAWHEGGDGLLACPACGRRVGLNDWAWDPVWGFGYLGFEFWDWPPFRAGFVTEFGSLLGHRMVLASGKL